MERHGNQRDELRLSLPAPRGTTGETAENRCKGLSLLHVLAFAEDHHREAFNRALPTINPELAELHRLRRVVTGGWYPMEWYRHSLQALITAGNGDSDLPRKVGHRAVLSDLTTGFLKVLTRFTTPEAIVRRTPWVFGRYFEHGKVTVAECRSTEAIAAFTECRGFDPAVWQMMLGACMGGLVAAGAQTPTTELLEGGQQNQEFAVIRARWR